MSQAEHELIALSPRILVIDDEQRIRDACRFVLNDMGFVVETAADGSLGLAMVEKQHFDILLLDLMMPNLSGFDVLSRLRDIDPDAVVIVITGYATLEHSVEAMKKGAFDFIPKPFTPDQLRAVVSKSLRYTHALQDIANTRSRLRVVVNRLMEGVMTTDTEKRIVLANPAFLHAINHPAASAIGKRVDEVISEPKLLAAIDQALHMPPDTFMEISNEITFTSAEGGEGQIFSARCTPFRGRTSQNLGSITVLHDITTIKKMEQIKSDFVSMVSHEIRSPINSLLMQIKIILDGIAGEVTAKQREILERASGKMLNLNNLVTELLDLSRIESGVVSHEKEMVSIARLLSDQVTFHSPYAHEKQLTLNFACPADLPEIFANLRNMEEVFANLITNAIKYSPNGGAISISATTVDEYVQVVVSDTGFGIAEEDLDKIFTRFYRVKNEKTRTIHGTGLGLAIVKSIIDSHLGKISITSSLGKGTTFTVLLPVAHC